MKQSRTSQSLLMHYAKHSDRDSQVTVAVVKTVVVLVATFKQTVMVETRIEAASVGELPPGILLPGLPLACPLAAPAEEIWLAAPAVDWLATPDLAGIAMR